MRPDGFGDRFGNLREKRMLDIREQQSDREGAPGYQRSRNPIRLIVEFLRPLQYPLACCRADVALVAQNLGDRDDGNIQAPRDIRHRDSHTPASITRGAATRFGSLRSNCLTVMRGEVGNKASCHDGN